MTSSVSAMPAATPATSRRSVGRLVREIWQGRWGYFFLAPAGLLLMVVHIYPIVRVMQLSVMRYDVARGTSQWAGARNYIETFSNKLFYVALGNTLLYTVLVVTATLGLALLLAYLIQPLSSRVQTFFKAAFYLPGVVSSVVLALVWAWLYNADFGLLNYLLDLVGVDPVLWLGDRRIALGSIAAMTVLSGLGVPLLLLLAAMGNISEDYYEAASLDGAGPLRRFWSVTLPLLRPTLLYLVARWPEVRFFSNGVGYVENTPGLTEELQPARLAQAMFNLWDVGWGNAPYYLYRDSRTADTDQDFGLVRFAQGGQPPQFRPAWFAYQTIAQTFYDRRNMKELDATLEWTPADTMALPSADRGLQAIRIAPPGLHVRALVRDDKQLLIYLVYPDTRYPEEGRWHLRLKSNQWGGPQRIDLLDYQSRIDWPHHHEGDDLVIEHVPVSMAPTILTLRRRVPAQTP